jgi:S-adenosylmethionine:diacylglycerol 3-amino-3-carboxypropyl transferase
MLHKKTTTTEAEAAKQEKQKEEAKKPKQRQEQSTADAVGKSVLKVLTRAIYITGLLGALNKMTKK